MPKDIVEAYALAVKAREGCTRKAFEDVINFCENDLKCSSDDSRKRNTVLLWSYDKLAQSFMRSADYGAAYDLWCKALPLTSSSKVKLTLGLNMLEAADKTNINMQEKATKIVETALILQKIYAADNDSINSLKMQELADKASQLLPSSKLKN